VLPPHFSRRRGELFCERVSLRAIAHELGTPVYVYSRAALGDRYRAIDRAFGKVPHLVCYSVKALSNLAVLALLRDQGSGFDVVSAGELQRVLKIGAAPHRIVFSGVGKTVAEIEMGLRAGILCFNAESEDELHTLAEVAARMKRPAPVALRINPDVDAETHPHIATGLRASKFGIPLRRARSAYRAAAHLPGLRLIGLDCHIGSQLTSLRPFEAAVRRLRPLLGQLSNDGHVLRLLNLGGGLGVSYLGERPPSAEQWIASLIRSLGSTSRRLLVEPGRAIAANAGVLLTRVIRQKRGEDRAFTVVDAGMNDLLRPALYNAEHDIVTVGPPSGRRVRVDVVGPVCESADFLARQRVLPATAPGDLLAVLGTGAYGFTMSSTYNSRPRPPEVLVEGKHHRVIRQRESLADLWRGER
jgi:diaminopimelate decarboxylase